MRSDSDGEGKAPKRRWLGINGLTPPRGTTSTGLTVSQIGLSKVCYVTISSFADANISADANI